MPEWVTVVILGLVEGITEFLPISSTGHLLLVQDWLAHRQSDAFLIIIQSGAVAAVLLVFKERVRSLLTAWRDPTAQVYLAKLVVAFAITGAGGIVLKLLDFGLPDTAMPVGVALLVGGVLFLVVEWWLVGRAGSDDITWAMVVAIGVAQLVAAVFPGTSRSGATILVALAMGLRRPGAVEFTFLLGVPTLLAAGALEAGSALRAPGGASLPWGLLALGTIVSAVSAFAAVRWLLHYVRSHTFALFGWYRIVVGGAVMVWAVWW